MFSLYLRERPRYGNKASIIHETLLIQRQHRFAGGFRQTDGLKCESWNDQTLLHSRTHAHTPSPEDWGSTKHTARIDTEGVLSMNGSCM